MMWKLLFVPAAFFVFAVLCLGYGPTYQDDPKRYIDTQIAGAVYFTMSTIGFLAIIGWAIYTHKK